MDFECISGTADRGHLLESFFQQTKRKKYTLNKQMSINVKSSNTEILGFQADDERKKISIFIIITEEQRSLFNGRTVFLLPFTFFPIFLFDTCFDQHGCQSCCLVFTLIFRSVCCFVISMENSGKMFRG